ncbi:Lrp/AsnC family transcriptional regulator [Streptomyces albidoflavus]|uniref:Lrp/AsnC family transcriptional regulator n=1 Tax=Streptomyces albidoflavus TaxID=1886 RepID=UPI00101E2541|nr:Lrp/AsnC family transcriptional regulator [Streptomyces albidoflavus]RZD76780.1 Lrp/AsnC family transcriptional regulator [Streptomyces albidoflavus]
MDQVDRELLSALVSDGRATYQDLGAKVRLSPNTVAERVRRLQHNGVLTGFHAQVDLEALGRSLTLLCDISLREDVARGDFERGLSEVPQVISAFHLTGEYDYELRLACVGTDEFEDVIDVLKGTHGVRRLRSRLILREVRLSSDSLLRQPSKSSHRKR